MTSTIRLTAPAKVNLFLGVHGETDERGYHRVDSVMSSIDLVDQVLISPAASLSVTCIPAASFPQEDNSAYRAAVAMGDAFRRKPSFEIVIDKHIPQRSGMGGASADAAAVILGLCDIWGIDTNDPRVTLAQRGRGSRNRSSLFPPPHGTCEMPWTIVMSRGGRSGCSCGAANPCKHRLKIVFNFRVRYMKDLVTCV